MSPLKSSLARSAGKLLGVFKERDLSLRGDIQSDRVPPPTTFALQFAMFGGGGSGAAWVGAGGGGGGYIEETLNVTSVQTFSVTIGAGGATPGSNVPPAANGRGQSGENSTFVTPEGTFTAYGGGGGGGNGQSSTPAGPGIPGGSGGGMGGGSYSPMTVGSGNKVTGTTNPAQASPPQPQTLSRVQGYDGGNSSGDMGGGGGGAGGVGGNAGSPGNGGPGGAAVTLSNFGPFNGTYGGGGGGCPSGGTGGPGGGNAGDGVMTNQTAKNATGYGNGGGGVREAGYTGGAATAGIFVLRVPDAVTITSPGGSTSSAGGYNYLQRTGPGTVTFS